MAFLQQTELVNIGSRDRQMRLALGIVFLAIGMTLAVYFVVGGVSSLWRALVFIPLALGFIDILEARQGVCPMLASKGQRNFDKVFAMSGAAIEDRAIAEQIRRLGRGLIVQSLAAAIVLTAITMLIPT